MAGEGSEQVLLNFEAQSRNLVAHVYWLQISSAMKLTYLFTNTCSLLSFTTLQVPCG